MEPRDDDLIRWESAFGQHQTDRVSLIVDRVNDSYSSLPEHTFVTVTEQQVELLPQLQQYNTVYPHIIRSDR